jgi:hypothetical protein
LLLDAAAAMRSEDGRARLLAALAPRLAADQILRALETAVAYRDERARATALAALAPRLVGGDLTRAHRAALDLREPRQRTRALVAFLPVAPDTTTLWADIGRALVGCFAFDRPSERRNQLLWFLLDQAIFAPPVLSPVTLDAIASHVIDVRNAWRWQ